MEEKSKSVSEYVSQQLQTPEFYQIGGEATRTAQFTSAMHCIDFNTQNLKNVVYYLPPNPRDFGDHHTLASVIIAVAGKLCRVDTPIPVSDVAEAGICLFMHFCGHISGKRPLGFSMLELLHDETFYGEFLSELGPPVERQWTSMHRVSRHFNLDALNQLSDVQDWHDLFLPNVPDDIERKHDDLGLMEGGPGGQGGGTQHRTEDFIHGTRIAPREDQRCDRGPVIATPASAELLNTIKRLYSSGEIMNFGVFLSYLCARLCAKSSKHVVMMASTLSTIANKYWLPIDISTTIRFDEDAIETMRVNITPLASTISVYCYAVDQAYRNKRIVVQENQFVQYRALVSLRLEYYGMTLLALAINVADKLHISPEVLCALSATPSTIGSIRTLIRFLARLRGQSEAYRLATGVTEAEIIDINGIAKYARLLNPQFFLELSTVKNAPLTFLWVCVQRRLTSSQFSADEVKASNVPFSGITPSVTSVLFYLSELIVEQLTMRAGLGERSNAMSCLLPQAQQRVGSAIGQVHPAPQAVKTAGPEDYRTASPGPSVGVKAPTSQDVTINDLLNSYQR